jgi:hypothetical protein
MFKLPDNNLQYVTAATFLLTTYAKYMAATKHTFNCGSLSVTPSSLRTLAKKQASHQRCYVYHYLSSLQFILPLTCGNYRLIIY